MKYLAACCAFKDETPYLREWIEYHRLVGVELFFMVSNDASPEAALAVLKPYVQRGEVLFAHCPGGPFVQLQSAIYLEALKVARGRVRWLAFLDLDEFLLPVESVNLPEVLALYEQYAAVAVNWACFGSSGLHEAPALQTAAYRMRLPDDDDENRGFKSILDPARAVRPRNPHRFEMTGRDELVDEFSAPVAHLWRNENNPFFGKRLRINHYRTRSLSEFTEKLARWRNQVHPELGDRDAVRQYWQRFHRGNVRDDSIQRFVPEIRRRLASGD